jgi:hypothetical protein
MILNKSIAIIYQDTPLNLGTNRLYPMILLILVHNRDRKALEIHQIKDGGDRRRKPSKQISLELLGRSALGLLTLPSGLL